jgi:hypothetical protein
MTTRSRGRCAGNGARTGLRRGTPRTVLSSRPAFTAAAATSAAHASWLALAELQCQLVEQPAPVLRGRPEPRALQLGDQQFQMRDRRLGAGGPRLGLAACRAFGEERRLQRFEVVGNGLGRAAHEAD